MRRKSFFALAIAALLFTRTSLPAQTNASASEDSPLQKLAQKVQADIDAGKNTEAELSDDLKSLDQFVASEKGTNSEQAAQCLYMKGILYVQVINNPAKATEIFQQLKKDFPNTTFGKGADNILAMLAKDSAAKKIQDTLTPGSVFPDFAETDLNGKPLSVAAHKGKVVLVDFWATWCGPCRAELPNVIATYKKHHDEGFDIIGVSLDSERDKLDDFLKQTDGMTWPEFYDGQGWSNKLVVKYGMEKIPFDILIGPDGKVIGKDLRGEELESAVSTALAKK